MENATSPDQAENSNNVPTSIPVCLITGGSRGIGLATAQRFASEGYHVAICGRDPSRLETSRDAILQSSPDDVQSLECLTIAADLNDVQQAQNVAIRTFQHFGRLDVLVNNAGLAPLSPFEEITPETFESTINVNIRSVFYLTQFAWAKMKQQRRGVIVNISSLSAVDPFPGFSLYGACKSWLDLLTLGLGEEGKPFGPRICSIQPGAVETDLLRGLFPGFPSDQCVQPSEVAEVVWDCVNSPDEFPSGQAFPVTNQPAGK